MEPSQYKSSKKPETILQEKIIKRLRYYEWKVIPTHGNKFQSGIPDLVAMHIRYPWKFIEVKRSEQFSFTGAQQHWFPLFKKVWIMTDPDEYKLIFGRPNWSSFLLRTRRHKSKEYVPAQTTRSTDANAYDIMFAMEMAGYDLMHTHGNVHQRGLPDVLAAHPEKGIKWVEIKNKKYSFTGAQLEYLAYMKLCKFPCWIIQCPSELHKLDGKPNLGDYV